PRRTRSGTPSSVMAICAATCPNSAFSSRVIPSIRLGDHLFTDAEIGEAEVVALRLNEVRDAQLRREDSVQLAHDVVGLGHAADLERAALGASASRARSPAPEDRSSLNSAESEGTSSRSARGLDQRFGLSGGA